MSFPHKGKSNNECYNLGICFLISMFSNHSTNWDIFAARQLFGEHNFYRTYSTICFSQFPLVTFVILQGKVQTFIKPQNRPLRGLILSQLIKGFRVFQVFLKKRHSVAIKIGRFFQNKLPWIPEEGRDENWHQYMKNLYAAPRVVSLNYFLFNFILELYREKLKEFFRLIVP